MSFEGVTFNKGQGGLNRANASTDAVMALVVFSPEAANPEFNKAIKAIQASDLDDAGFDEAYDANNTILLRHHVEEFFAYAPEGTLYVIPTDQPTAADFFSTDEAKNLFRDQTDIKRIGFVYNANVVDLDLTAEINASQAFVDALAADHILVDGIYLEARGINAATAIDLRALSAGQVSAVIAQDPDIATIDAAYANYAAVGAVLGMRAIRQVNENLGSVDVVRKPLSSRGTVSFPLTRYTEERWLKAALSDGTIITSLTSADKKQLTAYGYIYAGNFQGFGGFYFNGEPTCIELASDYSSGENNGVWNKAARGIRTALIPKVRGWFKRNAETGALTATVIKNLETLAGKPLQDMMTTQEISDYEIVIPNGQNPNDQTPLIAKASVTLGAIIHEFEIDLSLN
ncbi:DUF2586 family protein [Gramella lutea]|uniref:DUF2586 family protein n=1 Tax=Christiangramia lutea TaxID=1607951 RepID=A0A9X1V4U8_9FLAO|nr:DUF2586 family protein [Christiangramia lutea]MCH4824295.1 DUF2586 family protein [Christiangramia lutea]